MARRTTSSRQVSADAASLDELRRDVRRRRAPCSPAQAGALSTAPRVPAPFPVHRWAEHVPDVVVLPDETEEVAEVVSIANDLRIPVVPRDGGTGLTDGAVPLRGGIVVDVKRMNQIHEIDLENRTVTVGTGHQHAQAQRGAAPGTGCIYPDDPASYPCSLVGGRIGTSGWSLIGSRYGHTRDLVLSFEHVLPTGEVMHVGDGIGHKISKSLDAATSSSTCSWATRARSASPPRRRSKLFPSPRPSSRRSGRSTTTTTPTPAPARWPGPGVATFAGAVLFDEWKVAYLRRDDEAYIPQPGRRAGARVRGDVRLRGRGARRRQAAVADRARSTARATSATRSPRATGPARHDRYATPLHGRTKAGQVVPMSWHCEDAAINYTELPAVGEGWHAIVADLRERTDVFDDWGMFAYTTRPAPASTTSPRSTSASGSSELDDEAWAAWVEAKRDIAAVALEHGGSISACHGSCREGEVDLVPTELGGGFEVMMPTQAHARPEQHHEPRQVPARRAYEEDRRVIGFRAARTSGPPDPRADHGRRRHALRAHLRGRPRADERTRRSRRSRTGTPCGSSTADGAPAWMHDHLGHLVVSGQRSARVNCHRTMRLAPDWRMASMDSPVICGLVLASGRAAVSGR